MREWPEIVVISLKSGLLQMPFKVILNSIYGKTGEKRADNTIGNLFNHVIFAFITAYTRAQLYRFVVDNGLERDLVAFATDSICTTRDLNLRSSKLGDFSLDKSGDDAYYLQNGIYRFNGKWKERGLGSLNGKTIEHVDTIEKDGRLYLKLQVNRSTRLRSSILRGCIEDIGKIEPKTGLVDLVLNYPSARDSYETPFFFPLPFYRFEVSAITI